MINLPTLYLKFHNFTPFSIAFDPLLATLILIFMNFSEKKSQVLQYKTSDSYLHPCFILYVYRLVLKRPHFLALNIDIESTADTWGDKGGDPPSKLLRTMVFCSKTMGNVTSSY